MSLKGIPKEAGIGYICRFGTNPHREYRHLGFPKVEITNVTNTYLDGFKRTYVTAKVISTGELIKGIYLSDLFEDTIENVDLYYPIH